MSESAKSTVKDFEEDIDSIGTEANEAGDVTTTDGHAPISPKKKKSGNGDVTTTDGHAPIAPPKGDA